MEDLLSNKYVFEMNPFEKHYLGGTGKNCGKGWCTTSFTKAEQCSHCKKLVLHVHQLKQYDSKDVCCSCFDKIKK